MAARLAPPAPLLTVQSHLHHRPRRRQASAVDLAFVPQCSTRQYQCYHRPRLRSKPGPKVPGRRHFTSSASQRQNAQPDHYAALSLSPQASGKEIKKQFYAMSKKHHPDVTRHMDESEAAKHKHKFEEISEAYHTLGDPERKAKYDRERTPSYGAASYTGGTGGSAQYSRGGRPASGLSRRRSTFRGPPPSFYRSGGWGAGGQSRKRQQDADDVGRKQHDYAKSTHRTDERAAGSDASDWPFTTDPNDVPHFDRGSHYRTTTNVEEQLRQGRRKRRNLLFKAREDAMARGSGTGADAIFTPEEVGVGREVRAFATVTALLISGIGGGYLVFGKSWK